MDVKVNVSNVVSPCRSWRGRDRHPCHLFAARPVKPGDVTFGVVGVVELHEPVHAAMLDQVSNQPVTRVVVRTPPLCVGSHPGRRWSRSAEVLGYFRGYLGGGIVAVWIRPDARAGQYP